MLTKQVVKRNIRFLLRTFGVPESSVLRLKAVSGLQSQKFVQYCIVVLGTARRQIRPTYLRWHKRILMEVPDYTRIISFA